MEKIIIKDLGHIRDAAAEFINKAGILSGKNRLFALYGTMGAGKTTLVAAICDVLGVEDAVTSPTFTIVNEYRSRDGKEIFHFDFYRIEEIREVYDMGFEEYIYDRDGLCLMEWPEKVGNLLPEESVKVFITVTENGSRILTFEP